MKKCKKLGEYAQFIATIRGYLEEKCPIEEAVSRAMDECIRNGVLEEILRNHREEVRSMILTEYDEQARIKNEREIALEEGENTAMQLVQYLLEAGRTEDAKKAAKDAEYRKKLFEEYGLKK